MVDGQHDDGGVTEIKMSKYRHLGRRLACENSMFEVFFDAVEAPSGQVVDDFLIVRPKKAAIGGVVGICVVPEVDSKIGLMRGYRHQLDDEVWQAPAGFVGADETAEQAAVRELAEETGLSCRAADLQGLGVFYPDAGLIEGRIAIFAARNCYAAGRPGTPGEIGTSAMWSFSRSELGDLVRNASNIGASTLIACFRYLSLD